MLERLFQGEEMGGGEDAPPKKPENKYLLNERKNEFLKIYQKMKKTKRDKIVVKQLKSEELDRATLQITGRRSL